MDEARLARRLRRGDRLALNRAMEIYTPYLSAVVRRSMGPSAVQEDVEEVVSDAFLSLWRNRDRLKPEQGVKSWLAAVARNKAIDRLRTAPPSPLPLTETETQGDPRPDEELERQMFADALRREVEALASPDKELILRFYYEEEKLRDIAGDLGLSVPAAKTRLCRARQKLKERLTEGGLADGTDS
ncbi:MAG: RNA polymerase sigma factor [Oscillospiraceae bacterium]